jgi:hypothetical protein
MSVSPIERIELNDVDLFGAQPISKRRPRVGGVHEYGGGSNPLLELKAVQPYERLDPVDWSIIDEARKRTLSHDAHA